MKIRHQGPARIEKFPIDAASTAIVAGALMTIGITAETDKGCAIISGAAAADAMGVMVAAFAVADNSTPEDGLVNTRREIELLQPGDQLEAEYSQAQADALAVTSASGATITISSLEDNIDGFGWLYATEGPGAGHLGYIKQSDAGSCVLKSAPATAFTSATYVIKIFGLGQTLGFLNSTRDKLATQAAVGTARIAFLFSEVSYTGSGGWERLDPTKHDGLNLAGKNAKFRSVFVPQNTLQAPID